MEKLEKEKWSYEDTVCQTGREEPVNFRTALQNTNVSAGKERPKYGSHRVVRLEGTSEKEEGTYR